MAISAVGKSEYEMDPLWTCDDNGIWMRPCMYYARSKPNNGRAPEPWFYGREYFTPQAIGSIIATALPHMPEWSGSCDSATAGLSQADQTSQFGLALQSAAKYHMITRSGSHQSIPSRSILTDWMISANPIFEEEGATCTTFDVKAPSGISQRLHLKGKTAEAREIAHEVQGILNRALNKPSDCYTFAFVCDTKVFYYIEEKPQDECEGDDTECPDDMDLDSE